MAKYWKVTDPEINAKLVAANDAHFKWVADVQSYAQSHGAVHGLITRGLSGYALAGLVFDKDPNPKLWRQMQDVDVELAEGCVAYTPRRATSKASQELLKEFRQYREAHDSVVCRAVGVDPWQGAKIHYPGGFVSGGTVYLSFFDAATPQGCERVSDLEFEAAREAIDTTKGADDVVEQNASED